MIGNPLDRLAADSAAAARDLEDLGEPTRGYADQLADAFREEVPVLTGFLQSSIFTDDQGVGVGAEYAAIVASRNPYDERALSRVDPGDAYGEYVDAVLADHFQTLYI